MTVINRIGATITQHHLISRGDKIVVGVSGGPDSLALLHLLLALGDEWQTQLHVAHLNHALRGIESDGDAEFVAQNARDWGLPATVETRDVAAYARINKLSIEEAARKVRYAFLAEVAASVGAKSIAVAHNADDQAETILMHLVRGAGLAGLRGMQYKSMVSSPGHPPQFSSIYLIRPLLDVTRVEIETYCRENSLNPRVDTSNLDETHFRNRLRHEALPYLESLNPNIRKILFRTAQSIADDFDYIESEAKAAFAQVAHAEKDEILFIRDRWSKLHPSLQRLTLRAAIQNLKSDLRNIDWTHVENARLLALEKGAGAIATLPHGLRLVVRYGQFAIGSESDESRPSDLVQLTVDCASLQTTGTLRIPGSEWMVETQLVEATSELDTARGAWSAVIDLDKTVGELWLRRRRSGDRFQPAGLRGHTKMLSAFMIDAKIPRWARDRLPLLCDRDKILWVCGYRLDERVAVTGATLRALRIRYLRSGAPEPTAA